VSPSSGKIYVALSIGPNGVDRTEDGDRIQSPNRCVSENKQNVVLDEDKTMDNVQNVIFVDQCQSYRRRKFANMNIVMMTFFVTTI
jgi:hypothetical protein